MGKRTTKKLTPKDLAFIKNMAENRNYGGNPIGTWVMGSYEKVRADRLSEMGLVVKGHAVEDGRCNVYYLDRREMAKSPYFPAVLAAVPDLL